MSYQFEVDVVSSAKRGSVLEEWSVIRWYRMIVYQGFATELNGGWLYILINLI